MHKAEQVFEEEELEGRKSASDSRSRLSSKEKKTLITKGLLACFVAVALQTLGFVSPAKKRKH
jgi:hypothetical protein